MRIVIWNIERGYYPDETANFLRSHNADIYALCELDRGVGRTHGVDMFTFMQEKLGLTGYYAREFEEIPSIWRNIIPWGGRGGGEIGNAIFSRFPVRTHRSIDLPKTAPLFYDSSTWIPELFQPRRGSRQAQVAEIDTPEGPLVLILAHTELWRSGWEHRQKQLETALGDISTDSLIFAGDFNSVGGVVTAFMRGSHSSAEVCETRAWLESKGLYDPFSNNDVTCGRGFLKAKIDWVAFGKSVRVLSHQMHHTSLSDHSCLSVDFTTDPSSRA